MKLPSLSITKHRVCHYSHLMGHLSYLVLVFVESHGLYGIAAGVLALILIVSEVVDK